VWRFSRRPVASAPPAVIAYQLVFATGTVSHFLSARMGCQVLHPIYGLDLANLCIRPQVDGE
jgi:hypothetical protein